MRRVLLISATFTALLFPAHIVLAQASITAIRIPNAIADAGGAGTIGYPYAVFVRIQSWSSGASSQAYLKLYSGSNNEAERTGDEEGGGERGEEGGVAGGAACCGEGAEFEGEEEQGGNGRGAEEHGEQAGGEDGVVGERSGEGEQPVVQGQLGILHAHEEIVEGVGEAGC